jgi:hypothetical protein
VVAALTALVEQHGRWGFWKCFARLRLDGHSWNHKHVHRVYCALRPRWQHHGTRSLGMLERDGSGTKKTFR